MSDSPTNPFPPNPIHQPTPPAGQPSQPGMPPAPWQGYAPAVSNGPVLDPSPMDLGGVFRSASNIFKRQPALLLGFGAALMGLMLALMLGVFLALVAVMGWDWLVNIDSAPDSELGRRFVPTLLTSVFVAVVVGIAAQIKLQAMTLAGADQIADGYRASWTTAHRQSRGVLPRAAALLAMGVAAALAVLLLFGALIYLLSTSSSGQNLAVLLSVIPVLGVAGVVVGVRLAFVVPVLAIEGLSGVDVLRRSWNLTSGRGLNVFARILLGNILVSAVSNAPSRALDDTDNTVVIVIVTVLALLLSLAASAWQNCYLVAMYRDERSRTDVLGKQPAMPVGAWNQQPPQQQPWTPRH